MIQDLLQYKEDAMNSLNKIVCLVCKSIYYSTWTQEEVEKSDCPYCKKFIDEILLPKGEAKQIEGEYIC